MLDSLVAPTWVNELLLSYFTNRSFLYLSCQRVCLYGRCSFYMCSNVGILQGACLSSFSIFLAYWIQSRPVTADCWSLRMIVCLVTLTANALTKRDWMMTSLVLRLGVLIMDLSSSKSNVLNVFFYSKTTSPQLRFSVLNGEALSRERTVKYLNAYFSSNMTWYTPIDIVFTKCP